MKDLVQTNIPGLKKNLKTGMIVNEDEGKYQMIVAARKRAKENKGFKDEIDQLRDFCHTLTEKCDGMMEDIRKLKELLVK